MRTFRKPSKASALLKDKSPAHTDTGTYTDSDLETLATSLECVVGRAVGYDPYWLWEALDHTALDCRDDTKPHQLAYIVALDILHRRTPHLPAPPTNPREHVILAFRRRLEPGAKKRTGRERCMTCQRNAEARRRYVPWLGCWSNNEDEACAACIANKSARCCVFPDGVERPGLSERRTITSNEDSGDDRDDSSTWVCSESSGRRRISDGDEEDENEDVVFLGSITAADRDQAVTKWMKGVNGSTGGRTPLSRSPRGGRRRVAGGRRSVKRRIAANGEMDGSAVQKLEKPRTAIHDDRARGRGTDKSQEAVQPQTANPPRKKVRFNPHPDPAPISAMTNIVILWTSVYDTLDGALRHRDDDMITRLLARAFSLDAIIRAWRSAADADPGKAIDATRFQVALGWEGVYHALRPTIKANDDALTRDLMRNVARLHDSICQLADEHGFRLEALLRRETS